MRSSTENIYQQKVNQVIDYISANLYKPLQLDTLANQINVSQRQLLRIMCSSLNESLYSYIARQRVERAVLYLQTEDGMAFEEYVSCSEEDLEKQITKIYIPIK
jgi:transcriptional regulator GlxA family with amidase domain